MINTSEMREKMLASMRLRFDNGSPLFDFERAALAKANEAALRDLASIAKTKVTP